MVELLKALKNWSHAYWQTVIRYDLKGDLHMHLQGAERDLADAWYFLRKGGQDG